MRLKILFAPFVLALAVILSIWFIWPAFGDLRTQMQNLQSKQEFLQSVLNRKNNAQILKNSLDQNADKENFVLSYLPSQKYEEKIINSVNFLAASYQLNLINVNIKKEDSTSAADASGSADNTATDSSGTTPVSSDIQYTSADINVIGTYDNIVRFINNINKMEFLNKISSIEISVQNNQTQSPAQTQSQTQPQPASQSLTCNITVEFGRLDSISAKTDFSDPIFSQSSFNFSQVDDLTQSIMEKVQPLDDGAKGESNPFFP